MIDKTILKTTVIFSFIIGAILGVIPLIPAFTYFAFIIIMFFTAPFILIYLSYLKLTDVNEIHQTLTVGALSGFCSCLGFSVIFFPVAFVLQLIFKIDSFIWIKVIFYNIGFLIPMIILTALMSAIMNAFTAFITSYFLIYFYQNKRK